jgi:eukaryotic-like serine/threonine-protein kinase
VKGLASMIASGTRLGPYAISTSIGAGGMGEVYRATDTRLDRTVAIKVLPEHVATDPELKHRFEREAKTLAALSHPHICPIHDVGSQNGIDFLVMEYLEGETLEQRLKKGALPLDQALQIGIQIANALAAAHRAGIIHRDLKPGNIMLTKSGAKLLDFGLAKTGAPAVADSLSMLPTTPPNLTSQGAILGTFQYMAPEQLEGQEADARTDIFAFGTVLYEMATGKKAFWGDSRASLISSIMATEPLPVSSLAPMAPPALDRVVRRSLAKDPDRRWQSARDVALELDEISRAPVTATVAGPRPRRREFAGWIVAASLFLALLLALFAPWQRSPPTPGAPVRFTVSPPRDTALQGMLALSPDGRRLAFVATTADGRDLLWTRALDSLESRALEGTDGANYPFWSPDGRFLAFFAGGKLKKIEATGGSPQTLCDAAAPRGGSWGSAGTIVFAANAGGQIERVAEAGGQATPLAHLTSKRDGDFYFRWPSFLPDGNRFLYFTFAADTGRAGLSVASLDSPDTTWITPSDSGAAYVSSGFLFYRVGDRLMSQAFDAGELRVTGDPVPFVEDVWWDGFSTLATAFSTSSAGIVAYQTGGLSSTRLLWHDRSGKEVGSVGPPGAYFEPALSPDGRSLVVSRGEPGRNGLWTIDLERGSLSRLSVGSTYPATPLWSPDGRRIVYAVYPSGEVYVRDAQGAEKEKLLYKAAAFTPLDDWSRDGRFLLYDAIDWRTFRFDVGVRDLEKETDRLVLSATFNELGARLSPDGRWLAYHADESGRPEVFVRSFPEAGFRRQISSGGGTQPRWRGDGRELFYVSEDRKVMSVEVRAGAELEIGTPRPLFQTRILPIVEARNHYDVSADGQRFLVNSRRPEDAMLPINVVVGWSPEKPK